MYELYGVIAHAGENAHSGHYYSFLKINKHWYKFDDEIVTKVAKTEVF